MTRGAASVVPTLLVAAGCVPPGARVGDLLPRRGQEIVSCGGLHHVGARVVLWLDSGGYDAYRVRRRFDDLGRIAPSDPAPGCDTPERYSPMRDGLPPRAAEAVRRRGWTPEELRSVVDLLVIHYDACGGSRRCFEVLQDVRGLSVHFMIDRDGTIYQTLDLKERARHAGSANSRSIGVEMAHPGAYETAPRATEAEAAAVSAGVMAADGAENVRVARPGMLSGRIHGQTLFQRDFTEAQYESLAKLSAALSRIFPKLRLDAPRGADSAVTTGLLPPEALAGFHGIVGHFHLTTAKQDPGPAFDWERLLHRARALR